MPTPNKKSRRNASSTGSASNTHDKRPSSSHQRLPSNAPTPLKDDDGLSIREAAFVRIVISQGAKQHLQRAAVEAGYPPRSAHVTASRLIRLPKIQAALKKERERLLERYSVTPEKIVGEFAKLGFSNILDYVRITDNGLAEIDLSKATRDEMAAISEITSDQYTVSEMDGNGDGDDVVQRPVIKTKLKLSDKRAALVDLAKIAGIYKDGMPDPANDGASQVRGNVRERLLGRLLADNTTAVTQEA